jgi:shikimate kinase
MHARETGQLIDALAAPGPSVISAAASVIDDPAARVAMRAPGVVVIWLHARPDILAERFESADEHRPAYGDSPESFLAEQAARREPFLGEIGARVIDVDTITPDEVVTRALGVLG